MDEKRSSLKRVCVAGGGGVGGHEFDPVMKGGEDAKSFRQADYPLCSPPCN